MTALFNNETRRNKTVLVVEDHKHSLFLLKKMLEYMNFEVVTAENGREAVDICERECEFAIILMDLKMPVMDGYSAMKTIREKRPGVTIIAETAYALAGDENRILDAGFDDYLAKPITRENLSTVISRNLHQ